MTGTPGAAELLPARLGRGEAFLVANDDEFADELSERGKHMEHEPAAGRDRVERLVQGSEADSALAQSADERDQVLDRAAEAVEDLTLGRDAGVSDQDAGALLGEGGEVVVIAFGQVGCVFIIPRSHKKGHVDSS